jgi:GAF domain-containing protein
LGEIEKMTAAALTTGAPIASGFVPMIDPQTASRVSAALAQGPQPLFAELSALFTALPGVRTVTYLATAPDRSVTHRIGTSDATNFPIGGFDPIDDNAWNQRIFGDKQPVIGDTPEQMAQFIPETDQLVAMGYGSTLCAPIVISGEVRGTVNVLGDAGLLTPAFLAQFNALLPLAALVFTFPGISDR